MEWWNLVSLFPEQPGIMCFLKEYGILSIIIDVFLQQQQKKTQTVYNLNLIKCLALVLGQSKHR